MSLGAGSRMKVARYLVYCFAQVALPIFSYWLWKALTNTSVPEASVSSPTTVRHYSSSSYRAQKYYYLIRKAQVVMKFVFIPVLIIASTYPTVYIFLDRTEPHWYSWISAVCASIYLQFAIALITLKLISWIIKLVGHVNFKIYAKHRQFITQTYKWSRRSQFIIALVYSLTFAFWGLYNSCQEPTVKYVTIPIKGLPTSLDGFRIAEIADIHLGTTVGKTKIETIVSITNQLKPGII